ncbi:MAG: glycosyltransferase, partial [Lachnospiraceae bacterium]|nr:glycosyltransferase [Lachnospiraceae bacterium]
DMVQNGGKMSGNRKNILHVRRPNINNGVYKYIFNHMGYIDRERFQFDFLTRNAKALAATEEYRKYGFSIQSFCNTERNDEEELRREITDILRQGYDAIHLHTSFWRGFLIEQIAMEMNVPKVIVHSHSTWVDVADDKKREEMLRVHNAYKMKFDFRYATDVCACSGLAGDWLYGEQIPREKIQILPNAIDVEKYGFRPEIRDSIRKRLGWEDKIVIGSVGRYCYQKNQSFLIRAFAKAREQNKKLFLILIGGGELRDGLKKQIADAGLNDVICCMNWQEKVQDYFWAMDVFCLPSLFEGLAITSIEAQAAGLRCLLSDTISEEARVTDLVKFLPLDENVWAEEIAQSGWAGDRERKDKEIEAAGYDIRSAVKKLEKLYE